MKYSQASCLLFTLLYALCLIPDRGVHCAEKDYLAQKCLKVICDYDWQLQIEGYKTNRKIYLEDGAFHDAIFQVLLLYKYEPNDWEVLVDINRFTSQSKLYWMKNKLRMPLYLLPISIGKNNSKIYKLFLCNYNLNDSGPKNTIFYNNKEFNEMINNEDIKLQQADILDYIKFNLKICNFSFRVGMTILDSWKDIDITDTTSIYYQNFKDEDKCHKALEKDTKIIAADIIPPKLSIKNGIINATFFTWQKYNGQLKRWDYIINTNGEILEKKSQVIVKYVGAWLQASDWRAGP